MGRYTIQEIMNRKFNGILEHGGSQVVAAAGTAIALSSISRLCLSVIISMKVGNTGNIFIGNSEVDNTDIPWIPGSIVEIPCQNANSIFIDAAVNGEGINWQPVV